MSSSTPPPTCGRGLAENSTLPARLSDVTAGMAAVLENHLTALDPIDPAAKAELDVYERLADGYRGVAVELRRLADLMSGSRDLPMAAHDIAVLGGEPARTTFARLVRSKEDLSLLLRDSAGSDQAMLARMRDAG